MYTNGTSQPQAPTETGQADLTQTKPVDWDDDTQGVWEEKMAPFGGKFLLRVPDKDKAEKVRQSLPPGVPSRIATNGCDIFGMGAIIVMFVAISAGTLFAAYIRRLQHPQN